MNISHFFIDRPIFAAAVSVVITLTGLLSYLTLPVDQYPQIAPPTVSVNALYPGATAEEIADQVNAADPTINISSVYRSLTLFEDLDLVRESHLGIDGSARWEIAHPDDHFHMVCRGCGKVDHHVGELVDQVRSHLASQHDFTVDNVDLVVTGLCGDCS